MTHKVVIALDIDADTYAIALANVERWLQSRREGNALELYPEGTTLASTIPKLPHQQISVVVEPVRIYVDIPIDWADD